MSINVAKWTLFFSFCASYQKKHVSCSLPHPVAMLASSRASPILCPLQLSQSEFSSLEAWEKCVHQVIYRTNARDLGAPHREANPGATTLPPVERFDRNLSSSDGSTQFPQAPLQCPRSRAAALGLNQSSRPLRPDATVH